MQLTRNRGESAVLEAGLLIGLTALTAAAYLWTEAPLFNPRGIDPWLYTALWTNFDQTYQLFEGTYYVSRIPWIVPGYVLNSVLAPHVAALLLHGALFLAGGVFLYLLCRRFFGRVPATVAYLGLISNQLYFNAHRWDYYDGGIVTLLAASVLFGAPVSERRVVRAMSLACAGLTSAALVTTQLVAVVFLVGVPVMYVVALAATISVRRREQVGLDLAAYVSGCLAMLGACGAFAVAKGGPFLFFMPQIEAARAIDLSNFKQPLEVWLPRSPWFAVLAFVGLLSSAVLAMRWVDRGRAKAIAGSTVWLLMPFGLFAAWEFVGDGYFLEYPFYVSPFLPAMLSCVAGVTAALVPEWNAHTLAAVLGAAAAAVGAPLVWIYKDDLPTRVADEIGRQQYLLLFSIMGLAAAMTTIAAFVEQLKRWTGIAAVSLVLCASSYGISASLGTFNFGSSDPVADDLYTLGQDLIGHLREAGFADSLPYFWYDQQAASGVHQSVQSLYYYSYSYVGVEMPTVDSDFTARMELFQPRRLVLLCESVGCRGGARALERAGYEPRLDSRVRLGEGAVATWVAIYRVAVPSTG